MIDTLADPLVDAHLLHDCVQLGHPSPTGSFPVVAVYADGGVIARNPSDLGGTWAYCWVDAQGQRVHTGSGYLEPGPGYQCSNNVTELLALLKAIERLPDGWVGTIGSDSQVSLGRLFQGWKTRNIPLWLIKRAADHAYRLGQITVLRLDGHPTRAELACGIGKRGGPVSAHQQWCDQECTRLARIRLLRPEPLAV